MTILGFTSRATPSLPNVEFTLTTSPDGQKRWATDSGPLPGAGPSDPRRWGTCVVPAGVGGLWGTDRSRDRLAGVETGLHRRRQVEEAADSFIALGRGGRRLRSS